MTAKGISKAANGQSSVAARRRQLPTAEAERLGLDVCWVAEAWGSEAPSPLGHLAAWTERMLLGSRIIQSGTRTPMAVARAAITLSNIFEGRFPPGFGSSGPQVIEGLHGVPFARPLSPLWETVEIVRQAAAGEEVSYSGREFAIPLPGGGAKPRGPVLLRP